MSTPHMPRVEAGEAESKIKIGDRVMVALSVVVVSDSGRCWKGALSDGESSIWFDVDDLVPPAAATPAPQDTAEAMAEVERLARDYGGALTAAMGCGPKDDAVWKCADPKMAALLAAVRALADRATAAEAALAASENERGKMANTAVAGWVEHNRLRWDAEERATTAEAALASLRAEREVTGEWQDISTAPKDGSVIQITDGDTVEAAYWSQYPRATGGSSKYPWVFLDSTNETNGMQECFVLAWKPLAEPPRTLISSQKDRADGGKL